ncbi:MAG: T9SS type A sorting domain-containing protein [Saprospiraceae bacterium]|nr:T9SS type A sorting domain-containing protein [Saprospiraceae bacterium]
MKSVRLLLALSVVAISISLFAQQAPLKQNQALRQSAIMTNQTEFGPVYNQPGAEMPRPLFPVNTEGSRTPNREVILGTTVYDLQSNSSVCRRISEQDDKIAGTWTIGLEDPNYADRGTGYNAYDGSTWAAQPAARLESERTGWPNHVFTGDGGELIVSHTGQYRLKVLKRGAGGGAWTESLIPSNTPNGELWARAAVGGDDNQTIHVIAITTPVANGGVEYGGINGHILYYRSPDGGQTWDITDGIIPGLDSTNYAFGRADGYYIDARGDVVAIGIFNQWNDLRVFKSDDGGDTWTSTVVLEFPLEKYNIDDGYTTADLFNDPNAPDTLAILTNDETGTVIVDESGLVHCFFGLMYVQDDDTTDGNWSYFPATDGLAYWNELRGENNAIRAVSALDLNGNDTLDITAIANIALYYTSITSQPSAGIDASGNIYLAYSAVMEGTQFINTEDNQHYRHMFVTVSSDLGETWSTPYDLINADVMTEADLTDFVEAVFPSVVRDVSDSLRLVFQYDFRPGLSVRGDMDPAEVNFISYVSVPLSDLGIVGTNEVVQPGYFELKTQPNPTNGALQVSFELDAQAETTLDLLSATGQSISKLSSTSLNAGPHQLQFDLNQLPKGVYVLRMVSDNKVATTRVVKQ